MYEGSHTSTTSIQEVSSVFEGWDEEVGALLGVSHTSFQCSKIELIHFHKCIKKPTKWAIRALIPLDCYASGRVILAGDAVRVILAFITLLSQGSPIRLMQ
jgi:salicylate hydroxylase